MEKDEKGESKVEMERGRLEKEAKVESKAGFPQKQSGSTKSGPGLDPKCPVDAPAWISSAAQCSLGAAAG